jgi:hypothetical protein
MRQVARLGQDEEFARGRVLVLLLLELLLGLRLCLC